MRRIPERYFLFDRKCDNRFSYEGPAESRGRQLVAYTFQVPADGCFGPDLIGGAFLNPARSGRFLVDKDDRIVQFEMVQGDLGKYGSGEWKQVLFWDNVQVGNTSHRLPVSGDYIAADAWQVKVQYTNHRVFETSINLSFPGEAASERK